MMGRLFVAFIVISLILPSYLALDAENVTIIVKDYKGNERKAVVSSEEQIELEKLLIELIENENYSYLNSIFEKLHDLNLIEDIELKYFKINTNPLFPFYANFLCLIFGYGNDSWIEIPSSIFIILLWTLLSHLNFNFLEWLFISLYSYYHFYPKSYLPIAGWIIAGEGKVNVIGLLGYKRLIPKENFESPMLIVLYRFLGIAITFLAEGYEKTYVIGASMAMLAI